MFYLRRLTLLFELLVRLILYFQTFQVAFDGTKTINDAYRFPLHKSEEFTAAYVRIIPKSGNTRACDPALRVEFEGCTIGANNVNSKKHP